MTQSSIPILGICFPPMANLSCRWVRRTSQRRNNLALHRTATGDGHAFIVASVRGEENAATAAWDSYAMIAVALRAQRMETVFVKHPEYARVFWEIAADRGIEDFPAVCIVADVCREDLLFEIDAEAMVRKESR